MDNKPYNQKKNNDKIIIHNLSVIITEVSILKKEIALINFKLNRCQDEVDNIFEYMSPDLNNNDNDKDNIN